MSYYRNPRDDLRPNTPGTPGTHATFDTNVSGFRDNGSFAAQYDPYHASSPSHGNQYNNQTYYFDKEGGGAGAGAAATSPEKTGFFGWVKRHPVWSGLIGLLTLIVILGGAIGGGVGGSLASKNNATKTQNDQADPVGNSHGGTDSNTGGSSSNSDGKIKPLAAWNQTDPQTKIVGASLGNWLLIERWVDEDWFTQTGGDDAWDEYSFTKNLGPDKAKSALTDHWNSWVQESDIDTLKSVGINSIRIPVGYWAFVPIKNGEPYLAQAGQTDQIEKVLGWLYDRGMYAMIDLHGMPGSQSGDQASGHNTTDAEWWTADNLGYSYDVLNATIAFIKNSKYSSVVHSVCPVNEPKAQNDQTKLQQLTTYYENAYEVLRANKLIMQFHHAFVSNPYTYWEEFATGKDPNYIAMNDNPYPGWFPPNSDGDKIIQTVCSTSQKAANFPIPVVMTEYSVVNNVGSDTYDQQFYNTEVSAYAWSAGSYFWTFKTVHAVNRVLAEKNDIMDLYSLTTLINNGVVQKVGSTSTALQTIKELPDQQCGDIPTTTWTNPSTAKDNSRKRTHSRKHKNN